MKESAMEPAYADGPVSLPMTRDDASAFEPQTLPKEVGVLVMVAGVGGLILPGPIGTPLILIGGVILWPRMFGRIERAFQRQCPSIHAQALRQLQRFLHDLEARYPLPK